MDNLIKAAESEAFSTENIKKLCDNKVRVLSYTALADIDDLSDVLGPHKAAIILYETRKSFGHWCAIQQVPSQPSTFEFFDSLGLAMDAQLKFIPAHYRKESGQNVPHLTALVRKAPFIKKIIYNKHRLQSTAENVASCGRWAGIRIVYRDTPLPTFLRLFNNQTFPPDYYVTALTLFIR